MKSSNGTGYALLQNVYHVSINIKILSKKMNIGIQMRHNLKEKKSMENADIRGLTL
jgi:hypothetical protein